MEKSKSHAHEFLDKISNCIKISGYNAVKNTNFISIHEKHLECKISKMILFTIEILNWDKFSKGILLFIFFICILFNNIWKRSEWKLSEAVCA